MVAIWWRMLRSQHLSLMNFEQTRMYLLEFYHRAILSNSMGDPEFVQVPKFARVNIAGGVLYIV